MSVETSAPASVETSIEMPAPVDPRAAAEAKHGQVWDTQELQQDFDVLGFSYGVCIAVRKADGVKGLLNFDHSPRFYYGFSPSSK